MAFGKRSTISDNLYDYSIMICGESGVGKTTVISELCEKEFGEDGYLLLNTGDEEGVSAIEGVTYEDVPTYKKFVEISNDIIKNKDADYPNLKVVTPLTKRVFYFLPYVSNFYYRILTCYYKIWNYV